MDRQVLQNLDQNTTEALRSFTAAAHHAQGALAHAEAALARSTALWEAIVSRNNELRRNTTNNSERSLRLESLWREKLKLVNLLQHEQTEMECDQTAITVIARNRAEVEERVQAKNGELRTLRSSYVIRAQQIHARVGEHLHPNNCVESLKALVATQRAEQSVLQHTLEAAETRRDAQRASIEALTAAVASLNAAAAAAEAVDEDAPAALPLPSFATPLADGAAWAGLRTLEVAESRLREVSAAQANDQATWAAEWESDQMQRASLQEEVAGRSASLEHMTGMEHQTRQILNRMIDEAMTVLQASGAACGRCGGHVLATVEQTAALIAS